MRIHYIQHVPFEDPGVILDWAAENEHALSHTYLYQNETFPAQKDFDMCVIMGGYMNIYEEEAFPWLKEEKRWIHETIRSGKKVLGICLGAQLIADCLGGKVYKNKEAEIGWFPVHFSDEAMKHPFYKHFQNSPIVLHWHGDMFDIPVGAVPIASSEACKNQAFLYGNNIAAFQFHPEVTEDSLQKFLKYAKEDLHQTGRYIQNEKTIKEEKPDLVEIHRQFKMFLDQFSALQ